MKKIILLGIILCSSLMVLAGCGGEDVQLATVGAEAISPNQYSDVPTSDVVLAEEYMPTTDTFLTFNEAEYVMSASPIRANLTETTLSELTPEQISAVFNNLDLQLNAFGAFGYSGTLVGVVAHEFGLTKPFEELTGQLASSSIHTEAESPFYDTGLTISISDRQGILFAFYEGNPEVSLVHDVPVKAFFVDDDFGNGIFLQADFQLDYTPYNITLWHENLNAGKKRLSEVVTLLISSPPNLSNLQSYTISQ